MAKQRLVQTQTVAVEKCDWCGDSHDFPIEIVIDQEMDAMGLFSIKGETHDVVLTCPKKHEQIVVPVPVTLYSLQTFVRIQPRE